MKVFSAALLAIGAAAIRLEDFSYLPFAAPKQCDSIPDGLDDWEYFNMMDHDDSGDISSREAFEALYCAVEWGVYTQEYADFMYAWMFLHTKHNEDGDSDTLDRIEFIDALENLDKLIA